MHTTCFFKGLNGFLTWPISRTWVTTLGKEKTWDGNPVPRVNQAFAFDIGSRERSVNVRRDWLPEGKRDFAHFQSISTCLRHFPPRLPVKLNLIGSDGIHSKRSHLMKASSLRPQMTFSVRENSQGCANSLSCLLRWRLQVCDGSGFCNSIYRFL